MEKRYPNSVVAKILIILTSVVIIPFISPSFRSTYLLNLLIILLALESGILFESFSDTTAKPPSTVVVLPISSTPLTDPTSSTTTDSDITDHVYPPVPLTDDQMKDMPVEIKYSKSSLFIVSTATDEEDSDDGTTVDEDSDVGSQELFVKSETFIGNFYRQLKTEREEPPWLPPEEDTY